MKQDRLFVPLSTEPFLDFKQRGKCYEVRTYGGQYTEKFVFAGRIVELRKGYSGESLWGTIGNVVTGSLEDIFNGLDYRIVEPLAQSKEHAIQEIAAMLGEKPKYIAFQVIQK